jgi:hypothetical protein
MKKIVFCVLASFLLFGCANNFEDKKEQLDLIVERNEECQKYREVLGNKIDLSNFFEAEIGEIFYSSKTDSWLFILETTEGKEVDRGAGMLVSVFTTTKKLIDVFEDELIYEDTKTEMGEPPLDGYFVEFNEIVAEYKN